VPAVASLQPLPAADGPGPRDTRGRPLRDLRISVIDRCNFRCPYCMPEEQYPRDAAFLSQRERLTVDEIARLARLFVAQGVTKLRLTGGEPLLRRDLPEIVRRLAELPGVDLALTTNGALLAAQAQALRDAGLQRLTVSLDSIDPAVFAAMSGGRGRLDEVLAGIAAAERAGFARIKINVVVLRGQNDAGVLDLLAHFRGTGHVPRFIEYMDVGTCNGWDAARVVPSEELVARIDARWALRPRGRDYTGEVAERYEYVDGGGEVGFVSSVSKPFCGDCHRARLSADGQLFTCLFAGTGNDLRTPLRAGASDDELSARIAGLWRARADRYSELRHARDATRPTRRIEMYRIGG
jgi:cyclic pyranopterin phosphate synthase